MVMKFSRQSRLSGAAEFGAVFAHPRVSRDACFRVLSRPNGLAHDRLGMAVSRRVSRKAVDRNRLKRVIRESFREQQASATDQAAQDFVVLPSPRAATISNPELFESLRAHWRKQKKIDPAAQQRRGESSKPAGK